MKEVAIVGKRILGLAIGYQFTRRKGEFNFS